MTMAEDIRKVLIPSAGFGKRMGNPPAKELFPDPETGRPLIEFAFHLAASCTATSVVITRRDKTQLREALETYPGLETILIERSAEWTDTVMQSEPAWGDLNVLIMPDTRFHPPEIVARM